LGVLVVVVAVLGYLVIFGNNSTDKNDDKSSGISNSETAENENVQESSGKKLDLSNQGLSSLDMSIFEDNSITELDVSGNNLTGALPAEIRKLSNLEILRASNNNLTGIPAEIGQLSKLKYVDFSNNDISGLPLEIGNMSSLETFDLIGNPNVSTYDLGQIKPKVPNAEFLTD